MVTKLMKHELKALFRVLLYCGIADIVISGMGALFYYINPQGYAGELLLILGLFFSVIVAFMAIGWSIRQFYSSMFTGEGYMTHSLPVTPMQMVWAKLLAALIATFFGSLVCVASYSMLLASFFSAEDMVILGQLFGQYLEIIERLIESEPLLFVELAILLIVSIPTFMLFCYSIICIGQLFTKGRKWITFALGLGVMFIVLPILSNYCLDPILEAAGKVSLHLEIWINIIVEVALEVGMFFLIRYIMLHRVNLIV